MSSRSPASAAAVPVFARAGASPAYLTICIPGYNRPALLAEALAGIARQEDAGEIDVVVSDDGALDETRRVVEQSAVPSIRLYVNRPALGAVPNWNRGIELATTPWVSVLHEDDLLYPWFTRIVRPRLRDDVAAVAVRCVQGEQPPAISAPSGPTTWARYAPRWFMKSSMTPFPGVVVSREVAGRLAGFNPAEAGLADYDFWYRLACVGGIVTTRQTAAFYRVNEGQWTEREWPRMLRRSHLLRLRIVRQQFAGSPRTGRWLARYYTSRMARAYAQRFKNRPAVLARAQQFGRIPFGWLPSGWVWRWLKWNA